jgi:hypothetical protein
MSGDVEVWLADEARDHLVEGTVGLYEFLWWLDCSRFDLEAALVRDLARRLAARLVQDGTARLYRIAWPTYRMVTGPLPPSVLDDDDAWREGPEFVALVPVVHGEPEGPIG